MKELETLDVSRSAGTTMPGNVKVPNEAKVGRESSRLNESIEMASDGGANRQADKGSKKKKGKATGNAVVNLSESGADNQEQTSTKSKRGTHLHKHLIRRQVLGKSCLTIINSWVEKKKALLTNNAERMKRLLDNLQKKLDEV